MTKKIGQHKITQKFWGSLYGLVYKAFDCINDELPTGYSLSRIQDPESGRRTQNSGLGNDVPGPKTLDPEPRTQDSMI